MIATPGAVPTHVTVRVIAVAGKFLGDDVGGAQVTIRDPIGTALWPAAGFDVVAHIRHGEQSADVPLHFDKTAPSGAPSQFVSRSWIPREYGVFNIDVVASQKRTGNLGVGQSSVIFSAQ